MWSQKLIICSSVILIELLNSQIKIFHWYLDNLFKKCEGNLIVIFLYLSFFLIVCTLNSLCCFPISVSNAPCCVHSKNGILNCFIQLFAICVSYREPKHRTPARNAPISNINLGKNNAKSFPFYFLLNSKSAPPILNLSLSMYNI